jgi:O-antigen/teichoic acid export membrane protein
VRTIVNVLANWAAFVIGTAITFFLSPFVVHHLGDARYGLWAVTGSLVGYLGLLDLGIRVGVTRFVAQHEAQGDQVALNRLVSTALAVFAVLATVATVLGGIIALQLPHLIDVPADLRTEAATVVALAGVTVGIALTTGVYGAVIAGLQRFTALNTIDLSGEVLRAAFTVLLLSQGGGLVSLALLQMAVVTLRGVLYIRTTRRLQPNLRVSRSSYSVLTRNVIIRFSSYTMILHASAMVVFGSDAVVISAMMPVSQVAFFVIAGNLTQAALQLLGGVSRALYPVISARQAIDGLQGVATLLRDSVRLASLIFLPIVITFLARGRTFIGLWMGPSYAAPAGHVLEILALGLCVFASYQVLSTSIMALDLHRGLVPAYLCEAAANLGLSIVLGSFMGVPGVAWGTTLPRIAVAVVFAPWFCRRKVGLRMREYAIHAWVRPVGSMVPFGLASWILDRSWMPSNLPLFFLQVALLLPLAAAGAWIGGLERSERDRVRGMVRPIVGRVLGLT